jgi:hypothetical protein
MVRLRRRATARLAGRKKASNCAIILPTPDTGAARIIAKIGRRRLPDMALSPTGARTLLLALVLPVLLAGADAGDAAGAAGATFAHEVVLRAFLLNDQRLQWSGLETTFAAEAAVRLDWTKRFSRWRVAARGEAFLNQRSDANILADEYRDRYRQNFAYDLFSLKQLYVQAGSGAVELRIGKFPTPFGRRHAASFCNAQVDLPFIRAESIIPYDTGLQLSLAPRFWRLDVAVVNGSEDRDTNSAKAVIARLGLHGKNWELGVSGKVFGDRGSETQKQYSDHVGIDLRVRAGAFTLSGECIRERYGLRQPYPEERIFWPRSFYYRDIFYQLETPIKGTGGYVNLSWENRAVSLALNYGLYRPQRIGNPLHDAVNRRLLASCAVRILQGLSPFVSVLVENDRPREPVFSGASPYMFLAGLQVHLDGD